MRARCSLRRRTPERVTSPRSAFSLVELLVAVTLIALTMGSVTQLFRVAMRHDRQTRDWLAWSQVEHRLARAFRESAHRASDVRLASPRQILIFQEPGGEEVEFRVESERIAWVRRIAGEIRQRDGYPIPEDRRAEFNIDRTKRLVSLTLVPQARTASRASPAANVRLEAAFGLYRSPDGVPGP